MMSREGGRTAFGLFVIFSATAAALWFLGGLGIIDIAILGIVGGGIFYATMRLVNGPRP
jgi:hypothetical protein